MTPCRVAQQNYIKFVHGTAELEHEWVYIKIILPTTMRSARSQRDREVYFRNRIFLDDAAHRINTLSELRAAKQHKSVYVWVENLITKKELQQDAESYPCIWQDLDQEDDEVDDDEDDDDDDATGWQQSD